MTANKVRVKGWGRRAMLDLAEKGLEIQQARHMDANHTLSHHARISELDRLEYGRRYTNCHVDILGLEHVTCDVEQG